jgi:serine/threonine protein kinase
MGLARLEYLDQAAHDETATGVTLGTFDYISPEQARNPRDADIRSDIYSLGCTLFFMLTGRPPFVEGTVVQKLLAHQTDAIPDVRELRPDVPDLVASVLTTTLAKQPEDRFQNPAELCAALAQCIDEVGVATPPVVFPAYPRRSNWVPRATWWRRHAPWLVPVALLLISVAALGIKWRYDAARASRARRLSANQARKVCRTACKTKACLADPSRAPYLAVLRPSTSALSCLSWPQSIEPRRSKSRRCRRGFPTSSATRRPSGLAITACRASCLHF